LVWNRIFSAGEISCACRAPAIVTVDNNTTLAAMPACRSTFDRALALPKIESPSIAHPVQQVGNPVVPWDRE
jgi:hypothetical protein